MNSRPPGAATMSPTGARISEVPDASEARNTHFSHISSTMRSLARGAKLAPAKVSSIAVIRSVRLPSRSPKVRPWTSLRCVIVPLGASVTPITHWPPNTRAAPKRSSRRSRWAMPLRSGRMAVSAPIAGAHDAIASSRS